MKSVTARVVELVRALPLWARGTAALVVVIAVAGVSFSLRGGSGEDTLIPRGDGEETLAADDPNGSPHFVLTEDFDPSENESKQVPDDLKNDADGILEVDSAEFVDGAGPYSLVWKIENGNDTIDCINCVMLDARLKRIIKAVVDAGLADDVSEIQGVDPMRTVAGDYAGNGWQVEFVVGENAAGIAAGESLASWFRANSVDMRVLSVTWRNMIHGSGACGIDISTIAPVEAYNSAVGNLASARRDAAMDRVVVASPAYVPVFEDREGAQFVQGWRATTC